MSDVRPFRPRSSSFAALIATLLVAGCIPTFELGPTIPPWSATYDLEPELVAHIETTEFDPGPQILRLTLVGGEPIEFSTAERRQLAAAPGHSYFSVSGQLPRDLLILGTDDAGPWHLIVGRAARDATCWGIYGDTFYAGREPGGPEVNWIIVGGYRFPLAAGFVNAPYAERRRGYWYPYLHSPEVCLNADLEVVAVR